MFEKRSKVKFSYSLVLSVSFCVKITLINQLSHTVNVISIFMVWKDIETETFNN